MPGECSTSGRDTVPRSLETGRGGVLPGSAVPGACSLPGRDTDSHFLETGSGRVRPGIVVPGVCLLPGSDAAPRFLDAGPGRVRPGSAVPGACPLPGRDTVPRLLTGRLSAAFLSVLLWLLPAEVLACPSCTVRAPESSVRSALLLGALVLMPFLLVGVGLWAARRAAREERP